MENLKAETAKERQLRERATRDYAALNAMGITTGETFYPPGTEAIAGKSAIVRHRGEFFENPPAHDALEGLATAVQSENRMDIKAWFGNQSDPVNPEGLGVLSPGASGFNLYTKSRIQNLVPTERAIQQLMVKKPLDNSAANWDMGNWIDGVKPTEVVLRTRSLPANRQDIGKIDSRELFAVVSPDYVAYDIDQAAHDLLAACPADSRARVRYDGARARVDVIIQNPYRLDGVDVAAVGETHRMVLRMTTTDDASGGYHLAILAERVRCINLTLLHAKKFLLKATHRRDDLATLAKTALERGGELMGEFSKTWAESWHEFYADKHSNLNLSGEEAIRRIVLSDRFRIGGQGEDGTLATCLRAWQEEPGDTKAHVHNALTRAAHTAGTSWSSRWADDEAEVQASQLLYQNVSWLPEVDAN